MDADDPSSLDVKKENHNQKRYMVAANRSKRGWRWVGGSHLHGFWYVCTCSSVLVHKLGVELDDALSPVGAGGEECCAEVESVILLAEAGAGDDADTCGVQQGQAVELVGGAALGLGGFNGLGGEVNSGEKVHGTLLTGLVNK